jgi:ethanolamine utilization microcompartment shell protein EutS
MMIAPRIALIHATPLAIEPVNASFQKLWPQAKLQNILDDSLSRDLAADGHLTASMIERFIDLAQYAKRAGCQGILFTCSAFGEAIEAAAKAVGIPTLKPNEAMFQDALDAATKAHPNVANEIKIGLVATFAASIDSMREEFNALTKGLPRKVNLHGVYVPHAMDALAKGQAEDHHQRIVNAIELMPACDVIMLAQFSMAAAQPLAQSKSTAPILTSPDCAVMAIQQRMKNV